MLRSKTLTGVGAQRKVCRYGTKCYRSNPKHFEEEAHPADPEYLICCRDQKVEPEFVSVRKLFEWCDVHCSGKVTRTECEPNWPKVQALGDGIRDLDDALWEELDDDGNGHLNFSEFAEFTTKHHVKLPLGLDDLLQVNNVASLRCGVYECSCRAFKPRRRRCKYAVENKCFRDKNPEHCAEYSHPGDPDWETSSTLVDMNMCHCGHKRKLHSSDATGAAAVSYPEYWSMAREQVLDQSELVKFMETPRDVERFQHLVDATYSDVTTRDRCRNNNRCWMVPRNFQVLRVERNENSKLWRKYSIRKAELQHCLTDGEEPYPKFTDVRTTMEWQKLAGTDVLDANINEWYLFHGTRNAAALNICRNDFKMRLAGSSTGTLYGRGAYFAESITKADEYCKDEHGACTVLFCRVLGGRARYTDEREPDPVKLTADCVEGDFDCIIGDRVKVSKTYREFVVFDTENVYPEYIITFKRGELFKSASHP